MIERKYKYKPTVKQIRYHSYRDQNAPKEYWAKMGTIAAFIGARLEGWLVYYAGNPEPMLNNSIYVSQTKEKYGRAVVYCELAENNRVEKLWEQSKHYEIDSLVPEEFRRQCLLNDAKHYRAVYQDAFFLWPEYYEAIFAGADYKSLICHSKEELNELIEKQFYIGGFDPGNEKELKDLYNVCGF